MTLSPEGQSLLKFQLFKFFNSESPSICMDRGLQFPSDFLALSVAILVVLGAITAWSPLQAGSSAFFVEASALFFFRCRLFGRDLFSCFVLVG